MKKLTAIVLAGLLALSFMTGCGDKYKNSAYLGEWTATTASYAGLEVDVETILEGGLSFTLKADGTVKMTTQGEDSTGTWEETDNGIQFEGDEDAVLTSDDGKLVMEYSGATVTFEKSE